MDFTISRSASKKPLVAGRSALSHQVGAKHSDMGLTRWDHRRSRDWDLMGLGLQARGGGSGSAN